MKHEITNRQSTHSVLKMLFECKTFDQKNQREVIEVLKQRLI